ncbi:unnamed protein product, partial [Mesorhabditis spiculigera]
MLAEILRMLLVVCIASLLMVSAHPQDECMTSEDCYPGQICTLGLGHNVCYDYPLYLQGRRKRSTPVEDPVECAKGKCPVAECKSRICRDKTNN